MLTCQNLSLEINNHLLFKNLSFTAITGSLIIIRGPNGSGKTSLLNIITGLLNPNSGLITWNGVDINEDLAAFRSNLCYITAKNSGNENLTVFDDLHFWTRYRGESELFLPSIHFFRLGNLLERRLTDLSCGQKRRVELAKLLLFRTNLWLLDEPDLNLDIKHRNLLIDLIKIRVKEGGIIIMVTHNEKNLEFANYIELEDFR